MRKYNLPIFIPHRGCPHDCAFCSQRKITGVETEVTPDEVSRMVENFLSTIDREDSEVEIAFFGGSFTALELKTQEEFLAVAKKFFPRVSGIRLSTRPDAINDEILDLLQAYGVTTIELGVQSSDDEVLALNDRGHTFLDVVNASKLIKERGISLGHQMMLGMYGSTAEKDLKTVMDIAELMPECVRIYPVITLKNTKLELYYNQGKYTPYSIDKAGEIAKDAVKIFRGKNIEVIRIGLHSSDNLEGGDNIVAGPYHPAFGEIVESLIYREKIENALQAETVEKGELRFVCPSVDVSKAVGHKKMNKIYFKENYGIDLVVAAE